MWIFCRRQILGHKYRLKTLKKGLFFSKQPVKNGKVFPESVPYRNFPINGTMLGLSVEGTTSSV